MRRLKSILEYAPTTGWGGRLPGVPSRTLERILSSVLLLRLSLKILGTKGNMISPLTAGWHWMKTMAKSKETS